LYFLVVPILKVAKFELDAVRPFPDGLASFAGGNDWLIMKLGYAARVGHGELEVGDFSPADEVSWKIVFF
jgi:hypothetical protein